MSGMGAVSTGLQRRRRRAAPLERPGRERADPGQLALLETDEPLWRLDARTREVGRRGVAAAREVLRRSAGSDDQRGATRAA